MNFNKIFNGMIGKDFIKTFNDNFTLTDETFLSILATLLYKVKSTDIKEFKLIDGVVSYTLEDEPTEGAEDNRTWVPVDITSWGNIEGNLEDQEDLMEVLNDKATVETVETIRNLLSSVSEGLNQVTTNVENMNTKVTSNTTNIAEILENIETVVSSTTIKAIRLNNSVFQWSPDGRTWYEQPVLSSIAWGRITGDIEGQADLKLRFDTINSTIADIQTNISTLSNTLDTLENNVSNIDMDLQGYKTNTDETLNTLSSVANSAKTVADSGYETATSANTKIDEHLTDYSNPHRITKDTLNLGNVDNTSDVDKPVSNAQKEYIDNTIREAIEDGSVTGLIGSLGHITSIFVGTQEEYNEIDRSASLLAFVLDDDLITAYVTITSDSYTDLYLWDMEGNRLEPDVTQKTSVPYSATYTRVPYADLYSYGTIVDDVEYKTASVLDYTNRNTLEFNDIATQVDNEEEE